MFPIKSKTEVAKCLDQALVNLKTMFYSQLPFRFLRVDNGTEFVNTEVQQILRMFEMQYQYSEPS